jgi:Uma2 family endonuclease
MSLMTTNQLSAEEYLATDDLRQRRTELLNGEVIVHEPSVRHQRIVQLLDARLFNWVEAGTGRGESPATLNVKLDDTTVMAPDCLWFAEGVLPANDASASFVVPQLVVEVRSPSTWRYDTTIKFRKYETAGVAEVWLVDTASNTVLVYRRSSQNVASFDVALELGEGAHLTSPMLDGFSVSIAEIFNR